MKTSMVPLFPRADAVRAPSVTGRTIDPLPRLLTQIILRCGAQTSIDHAASRPWSSALFEGRRHAIRVRLVGTDAAGRRARFVDGLDSAEWVLSGHFVADICVDDQGEDGQGHWLDLSALTICDW